MNLQLISFTVFVPFVYTLSNQIFFYLFKPHRMEVLSSSNKKQAPPTHSVQPYPQPSSLNTSSTTADSSQPHSTTTTTSTSSSSSSPNSSTTKIYVDTKLKSSPSDDSSPTAGTTATSNSFNPIQPPMLLSQYDPKGNENMLTLSSYVQFMTLVSRANCAMKFE